MSENVNIAKQSYDALQIPRKIADRLSRLANAIPLEGDDPVAAQRQALQTELMRSLAEKTADHDVVVVRDLVREENREIRDLMEAALNSGEALRGQYIRLLTEELEGSKRSAYIAKYFLLLADLDRRKIANMLDDLWSQLTPKAQSAIRSMEQSAHARVWIRCPSGMMRIDAAHGSLSPNSRLGDRVTFNRATTHEDTLRERGLEYDRGYEILCFEPTA